MDENLPADWDQFFTNNGEVPASLQTETVETVEGPVEKPVVEAVVEEAAKPVVEAPGVDLSQYERMLNGIQEQNRLLQQQLEAVKASIPKPAEPQAPDPTTDPLGNLQFQMQAIQKQISDLTSGTQEQHKATVQETQMKNFIDTVNSQVSTFKTTHADYDDAYNHLVKTRVADFVDRGMNATQAREAVGKEEMEIAARAVQNGKNPADIAYNMAKRYGYVAKVAAKVEPENKLDTIRKGIESTKDVESEAGKEELSLANLREADDKQLDRLVRNDWDGIFGKKSSVV